MRRLWTVLLVIGGLPSLVSAGTITLNFGAAQMITTTAAQDAALARILVTINKERLPATPFATVEGWLRDVLQSAVASYVAEARTRNADDACVTFRGLPAPQQATITGLLGGNNPCP